MTAMHLNTTGRTYGPHEVAVLGEAFRRSCDALKASGDYRFKGRQAHYAQETIAKLILGYASVGERDPDSLVRAALTEMNGL